MIQAFLRIWFTFKRWNDWNRFNIRHNQCNIFNESLLNNRKKFINFQIHLKVWKNCKKYSTNRINIDRQLHIMIFFFWFHCKIFLNGEFWCFAIAPIPWWIVVTNFHQTRKPFFSWINQLESSLFHHQMTSTIMQFSCRCSKEFIAIWNQKKKQSVKLLNF